MTTDEHAVERSDETADGATDPDDTIGDGDPDDRAPGRRWPSVPLPWLVAALAILVAGFSTVQWLGLQAEADAREEVQRAAAEFMATLTNWDATDGLEATRDELRAVGTGPFLDEVDELFGGSLGADLEAADAVSDGEVQDVFVQRIEGDEAVAFGVVLQRLETNLAADADRTLRSARITLQRVDGVWLVSNVQLLMDDGAAPPDAVADGAPGTSEQPTTGTDAPGEEPSS